MHDDELVELLSKPPADWGEDEMRDAIVSLSSRYGQAMDGWGQALEHCDYFSAEAKRALKEIRELRAEIFDLRLAPATRAATKRGRGRPKKHYDLSWLLEWEREARKKFGDLPDGKLIRAQIKDALKERGMRVSRLNAPDQQAKMETWRKQLVEARRQRRKLSEK